MSVHEIIMAAAGIPKATPTVEYLVVGGGGWSGNCDWGWGGGGAGGFLTATGYVIAQGSPITVAVGGTAYESNGGNSIFGSITAYGGGRGATNAMWSGYSGGSSGGAANGRTSPAAVAGQGNRGGTGDTWFSGFTDLYAGGGGGGAGGAGEDASGGSTSALRIGSSGPGRASSITGTSVTYATGGGYHGGAYGHVPVANVGDGGVDYGLSPTSGVVIIRYPNTFPDPASVTGSPTITNVGGYKIYQWTSVGTWSITF